jgi:hypothetical protein
LAAGLLATYVKRSLDSTGLTQNEDGTPPPNEILAGLNKHILDIQLEECQFITAAYVVYNERTRLMRWARAGAPYPILVRPGEQPRELVSSGPLLGVLPEARFEVAQRQLSPGDTVVFHTDGLDAFLAQTRGAGSNSRLSPSDLFYQHGVDGFAELWREFSEFVMAPAQELRLQDDLTVIALHVEQPPAQRIDTPLDGESERPARVTAPA